MPRIFSPLSLLAILLGMFCTLFSLSEAPVLADPPAADQFDQKVLPLLKDHCLKCHGDSKNKGGLRLTSREALLQGGDSGPVFDRNKPEASLLLQAIHYQGELRMPPSGKLPEEKIKILEDWFKSGAAWPASPVPSAILDPKPKGGVVTPEAKNYWAYKTLRRPDIPTVQKRQWISNPIDAFLLARLESQKLVPNPPADRLALIRRATYDLTGLPPRPEEIDAFLQDASPTAYEKLIDRLLASPHYGEKWGRHWLDVVRFAETNGYERDGPKPFAWRFRDYVIRSLNDDKPFDQFIREQLAGDEYPGHPPEAVIATGYYRLGLWDDEPADPLQARADEFDDIVATTCQAFLGMTMNCARCHDHKIDPIPQADYYRFSAFFADISRYSNDRNVKSANNLTDITPAQRRAAYEQEFSERQQTIARLEGQTQRLEAAAILKMPAEDQRAAEGLDRPLVLKKVPAHLPPDEKTSYLRDRAELERLKKIPEPQRELALSVNRCKANPPPTFIMIRGSAHAPGSMVSPGFPSVLTDQEPKLQRPGRDAASSGRRTVLANWIASSENPLTARVFVNRVWQHHFGRGIVASANDFGKFGEAPTHPELLDWLASEFMAGGWKIKRLHKLIMLSSAYQMSSRPQEHALKVDPENRLFWRNNMRRLTAEEIRDTILTMNGSLDLKVYGPSIYPQLPREVLAGQSMPGNGWPTTPADQSNRRSVYIHVKRSLQVPLLATHDQADTDSSCPVRYTTTVPTQALGMLNGDFTNQQAELFAKRLQKERPGDLSAQIHLAIRLTTGRTPSSEEVQRDADFIRSRQTKGLGADQALKHYALLLLNTNEFVYLD
jgi:hypothetical protein